MKKGDRKSRIKTAGEEEEERMWKNRSFTWMELGILYSPDLTPAAASRRLKVWVTANAGLLRSLGKTGWNRTQRILTPRQVGYIVEVLGEP